MAEKRKKLNRKKELLFGAFIFLPVLMFGHFTFDQKCQEAYRSVLSLQFTQARNTLSIIKKDEPSNLVRVYLENYIDFLTVFISEEPTAFEKFRIAQAARMQVIENGDRSSAWYNYSLGNMQLQWALARLKFGEFKSAIIDLTQAYRYLDENNKRYPAFLPDKTGLGLIHIMAGLVPDNYSWILKILGIEGDIEQGLSEIAEVSFYSGPDEVNRMFKVEALFYLAYINANLGKDKNTTISMIRKFDADHAAFPDSANPLLIYVRASIFLKSGMNDEASESLSRYHYNDGDQPFYYLDYLNGQVCLNRLDPCAAGYYIRFLSEHKGRNYIKSAYQKLAWTFLLDGELVKYKEYINSALVKGDAINDVDRQAFREARTKEIPNVSLLRARLLFDGGYYSRALDELLNRKTMDYIHNKKDLVEYNYRLGRIYQESGNTGKALVYYSQAIHTGMDQPWYFAANSALQEGMIYEEMQDFINAEKYYRLVLSMNFEEYKTSLCQKAKAGLKRLKKKPG
jgi:hypothetical protein